MAAQMARVVPEAPLDSILRTSTDVFCLWAGRCILTGWLFGRGPALCTHLRKWRLYY